MTKSSASKSLKDQNRWQLWLTIALNGVVFYAALRSDAIEAEGWKVLFTSAANLLPLGLALVVTSVANGLLSANLKARLVFLRWTHALPGHRAFSEHAITDPRIDIDRLKTLFGNHLPVGPEAENKAWYRLFKEVEAAPEVQHVHREFLLMRDYASLSALFFLLFGIAAFVFVPTWKIAAMYVGALFLQFVIVRHAAATYGNRFVCTVLAVKSSQLPSGNARAQRK